MTMRRFATLAFVVTIAFLGLLISDGAPPAAAQVQPISFASPASAPDPARVSAALRSAPVMFIENAGQLDAGGGNGLIFSGREV